MILKKLNGVQFKELIVSGAKNLRAHYQEVDNLNVFPVPDGDTGTNMCRTIEGGVSNIVIQPLKISDVSRASGLKKHSVLHSCSSDKQDGVYEHQSFLIDHGEKHDLLDSFRNA